MKSAFLPEKGFVSEPVRAAHTGVCRTTWREMAANGQAPGPIKLGPRMTRYSAADLHQWIDAKAAGKPWQKAAA